MSLNVSFGEVEVDFLIDLNFIFKSNGFSFEGGVERIRAILQVSGPKRLWWILRLGLQPQVVQSEAAHPAIQLLPPPDEGGVGAARCALAWHLGVLI